MFLFLVKKLSAKIGLLFYLFFAVNNVPIIGLDRSLEEVREEEENPITLSTYDTEHSLSISHETHDPQYAKEEFSNQKVFHPKTNPIKSRKRKYNWPLLLPPLIGIVIFLLSCFSKKNREKKPLTTEKLIDSPDSPDSPTKSIFKEINIEEVKHKNIEEHPYVNNSLSVDSFFSNKGILLSKETLSTPELLSSSTYCNSKNSILENEKRNKIIISEKSLLRNNQSSQEVFSFNKNTSQEEFSDNNRNEYDEIDNIFPTHNPIENTQGITLTKIKSSFMNFPRRIYSIFQKDPSFKSLVDQSKNLEENQDLLEKKDVFIQNHNLVLLNKDGVINLSTNNDLRCLTQSIKENRGIRDDSSLQEKKQNFKSSKKNSESSYKTALNYSHSSYKTAKEDEFSQ